jgi:cytochrome b6-f complex iron-sulfur subunit
MAETPIPARGGQVPDPAGIDERRRTFLDAVLAFGFVSTAVAVVYPVSQYIIPPESGEPATTSVTAARLAELGPNAAILFRFGSKPGVVLRTPDGDIRAFSAVCTHLDCTVQYRADRSQLWCPCHDGSYDLAGNVVSGPPPRPLERFTVRIRGEAGREDIVVSRS